MYHMVVSRLSSLNSLSIQAGRPPWTQCGVQNSEKMTRHSLSVNCLLEKQIPVLEGFGTEVLYKLVWRQIGKAEHQRLNISTFFGTSRQVGILLLNSCKKNIMYCESRKKNFIELSPTSKHSRWRSRFHRICRELLQRTVFKRIAEAIWILRFIEFVHYLMLADASCFALDAWCLLHAWWLTCWLAP